MAPVSKDTSEDAPVKKRGLMGKLLRGVVYLLGAGALAAAGFAAGFVYFANPLSPEKGVLSLIEEAAPATEAPTDEHATEDPERAFHAYNCFRSRGAPLCFNRIVLQCLQRNRRAAGKDFFDEQRRERVPGAR